MKLINNNEIINNFIESVKLELKDDEIKALKIFLNGLVIEGEPSIKKIAENTIDSFNERTMNRKLKSISMNSKEILKKYLKMFQEVPYLAFKKSGVLSLDEHIIGKSGEKIEGVDYYYSPVEKKNILGLSMISVHYYDDKKEYPVIFDIYRKKSELEKYKKEELYKPKNEIARDLIDEVLKISGVCNTWVFDRYFMTKDTAKLLIRRGQFYVSKIKRNWNCTYKNIKYRMSELYNTIKEEEFEIVKVKLTYNKEYRYFKAALRNVFIKKLGDQLVLFIKELKKDENGNLEEKYNGNYQILVSNMTNSSMKEIIKTYMKRWRIETSYRDQNQNLGLCKCRWRNIEGQYCFIALVFLAYLMLCWAQYWNYLEVYSDDLRTIGAKKEAYKRYSIELFSQWITNLKKECEHCKLSNLIYKLVYNKKIENYRVDLNVGFKST